MNGEAFIPDLNDDPGVVRLCCRLWEWQDVFPVVLHADSHASVPGKMQVLLLCPSPAQTDQFRIASSRANIDRRTSTQRMGNDRSRFALRYQWIRRTLLINGS
jgi:hypothetical protein